MKINLKILFLSLLGIGAIFLLLFFEKYTNEFFTQKNQLLTLINEIKQEEMYLDYQTLKTSFFLYQNYDSIVESEKKLHQLVAQIQQNSSSALDPIALNILSQYELELYKKENDIELFKTYNAALKNSTLYLATLLQKLPEKIEHNREYEKLVESIIAHIFIVKNSLDEDFIQEIENLYQKVKTFKFKNPEFKKFHLIFTSHVKIFIKNFPKFKTTLISILESPTKKSLEKFEKIVNKNISRKTKLITYIFYATIFFYILSLLLILYFLSRLDRENQELKLLQQKLNLTAITDELTGLYNRHAFQEDAKKVKKPFFAIVNINGFKHYNDFYGNALGDHILKETAKALKIAVPHHYSPKFYRIGGDDFGILIEEDIPINEREFAKKIVEYFSKHTIIYKSINLYISVSIGMSRKRPLLETADMALKFVKRNPSLSFAIYNDNLGCFQAIKENLKRSTILKKAVEEKNIKPYFQPILDLKTGKIVKYEALARIKNESGFYESIFKYLPIAKEMKLYDEITKIMFLKSFQMASKANKAISINVSMKDIENPKLITFLGELFKEYPKIPQRLTFEILESETLKDYNAVRDFISVVKAQGCKVAIDDFGSGYSNFAHIFNLNIDYIKIDGSLIKNLPSDKTAQNVVLAIQFLAKRAGIETIAEFVHSQEVLDEVKRLGIDYAQGFHIGRPEPNL